MKAAAVITITNVRWRTFLWFTKKKHEVNSKLLLKIKKKMKLSSSLLRESFFTTLQVRFCLKNEANVVENFIKWKFI